MIRKNLHTGCSFDKSVPTALVLIAINAAVVRADRIVLDFTLSEEAALFQPSLFGGFNSRPQVGKTTPLGVFDRDFSTVGDTQLSITFNAPAGMRFLVDVPEAALSPEFALFFFAGNSFFFAGRHQDEGASITFTGYSGDPIAGNGFVELTGPSGNGVSARSSISLAPGSKFSFDAVAITTAIPQSYNVDFDRVEISSVLVSGRARLGPQAIDPGQWVSLVLIPEPASACLAMLTGLSCTLPMHRWC